MFDKQTNEKLHLKCHFEFHDWFCDFPTACLTIGGRVFLNSVRGTSLLAGEFFPNSGRDT